MGYDNSKITISLRLSNHNDERDERDRRLWSDLEQRIRELIKEPQYAALEPDID